MIEMEGNSSIFYIISIDIDFKFICFIKHSQDSYIYDENIPTEVDGDSSGLRLVGGSRANTSQLPFVVGFSLAVGETDFTSCTGGYHHIL